MYFGEYSAKLDEKGRISVPRRFRSNMEAFGHVRWYMTRGFNGCIALYHQTAWDAIRERLAQFPSMDARALAFRRMFFGSAADAQVDGQGRLSIPPHLREIAALDKDGVLVGVDDHLELWSKAQWAAYQETQAAGYEDMATHLFMASGRNDAGAEQEAAEDDD